MDLEKIYAEVVKLREAVESYHTTAVENKTDVAWLKRAVLGGFSFIFTVLGALTIKALS